MSKRNGKPLEWIEQTINTTDATVTNARIELGLRDDEVAELHKIDDSIQADVNMAAGDTVYNDMMLSMDPDVIADPSVAINHEDLEVFLESNLTLKNQGSATAAIKLNQEKSRDFHIPILVGTDVGMVVKGDANYSTTWRVRLFFTRRKANVMELNQILLKRR